MVDAAAEASEACIRVHDVSNVLGSIGSGCAEPQEGAQDLGVDQGSLEVRDCLLQLYQMSSFQAVLQGQILNRCPSPMSRVNLGSEQVLVSGLPQGPVSSDGAFRKSGYPFGGIL